MHITASRHSQIEPGHLLSTSGYMRIAATIDVPNSALESLASNLAELTPVELDAQRTFFKSSVAPSWIALLADSQVWVVLLGPTVAMFFGEVVKEAGKDVWRNRQRVGQVLAKPILKPLKAMASAIAGFRATAPERTDVEIGFASPDPYFGTRLRLSGSSTEEIASELAVFVHYAPVLQNLLQELVAHGSKPVGQVTLALLDDGSLTVTWMDRSATSQTVTFPPVPEA